MNIPEEKGQLINSVSLPVHVTDWKRILPSPGPNAAGEPTADASEKKGDKLVNCLDTMNTSCYYIIMLYSLGLHGSSLPLYMCICSQSAFLPA